MNEIIEIYKKEDKFIYLIKGEFNVELIKLYINCSDPKIDEIILKELGELNHIMKTILTKELKVKIMNKRALFLLKNITNEEFWIYFKKWIRNL